MREIDMGRNLTHGLLDHMGRAIVVGDYADRPFPTEADLSLAHGVSRSVTREAVKMLTAKGLVSARPRRGTIVEPVDRWNLFDPDVLRWLLERRYSPALLRHFTQLRIAIEPAAAALAAVNGDAADMAQIAAGLDRMRRAERGDGDPLAADIAFHVAILDGTKNPFFAQFRDVVRTALNTSIRLTNRIRGHTASIADHAAVADAIAARDPDRAGAAMRAIIADVVTMIENQAGAAAPTGPDGAASPRE